MTTGKATTTGKAKGKTTGKRRSKRTTQMLRNRYPHGVNFHLVKDKDGDTAINPPQDDITCNTADENVERTNTPLQSSQHHGDKKSSYNGQWTEEDMECAMKDVEDNSYSIRAAGKKWGIPASTLTFWLSGLTTTKRRGPPTILSLEEELEIVDWCKDMAQLGHGLEIIQLKSHVAHICETRPNPFKNGFPGRSWWTGFRKRHPDLTIRTAEGLDRDRAVMLRPSIVTDFYDNLEKLYNASEYGPTKIWNCDETGVQAGRNCGMRVIAKLGSRSVPQILSKSREWITILCCVNAAGHSIPGFYLFKAKRQLKNYIANCEPGACMAAQPHAWMTKELFLNWLYHFARSVPGGVSPTNRHLLIFDGHRSHVALTTIHEARSLGIDLLTLPAHTSHKLQPLDVSVFSPFKAHFKSERSKWMAKHPHIEIRRTELAELASKAFKLALTSENIIAGFRRTGIWPLNKDALCNDMRPSDAFNLQDDSDAAGIASILRLAGFGEAQVEDCLEQCVKQMKELEAQQTEEPTQQTEEPTESTCSPSHISQTQYENGIHEDFSLPSQFEQPNWIKEGAEHLGIQIDMENEEVSLSMPSPPMLSSEVIHYYADTMDWENSNLETNEVAADEQDGHNQGSLKTTAAFEIEDEAEEILCSQGSLKKFLKLPIERVRNRSSLLSNNNALKLGSKSQILTSDEYIIQEQKKEAKKAEIEELKERKKKQKEARKLEQIARRKRKDEEKLERQIIKQRKEEERAQQQKERELKKKQKQMSKQKKPAKEQVNEDVAIIVGERSTPSTPLPQHHQILQDMYNILTPAYAALSNLQAGYHNNLEHTAIRAGQNSTPSTPLPGHHQILRDMYNILTPAYAALNNIHVPTSHSPPHSPIKQFQFGGVLDENIFGSITPITPQVDAAIAEKTMTRSPMEEPDAAVVEKMITRRPVEEPEPFPGFMVN